jgi:hypothetical protein
LTATPRPSTIVVRAGAVVLAPAQASVTVPLDLTGAAADQPVGILRADVQYDAAILKAVTCTVGNRFDLLLCNLTTPGRLQLAGVAASGVRTDSKLADLGFELLQPLTQNTQLMVQLGRLADDTGSPLAATAQNGQISAPCLPDSAACPVLFDLYLPFVQR